jgi:membrane associated rhomboid family serine protease
MVGLPVLKKMTDPAFLNQLWFAARARGNREGPPCPVCLKPMDLVNRTSGEGLIPFPFCPGCEVAWLGPEALQALPPLKPPVPDDASDLSKLPPEAAKTLALLKVKKLAEEARQEEQIEDFKPWERAFMFFGLPMKSEDREPWIRFPWASVGIVLVTTLVSLLFFHNAGAASAQWGFQPSHWYRHFCLTFLTSFFIHGNGLHLLTNMYFFLLFGLSVEKKTGPKHLLGILFLSALIGDVLTCLWNPLDDRPEIGASGGIAGVMVFYALTFPRSNLYFYSLFFGIVSIPAVIFILIWVLTEGAYGLVQVRGWEDGIGHFAHFGGAVGGLFYWFYLRKVNPPWEDELEGI